MTWGKWSGQPELASSDDLARAHDVQPLDNGNFDSSCEFDWTLQVVSESAL